MFGLSSFIPEWEAYETPGVSIRGANTNIGHCARSSAGNCWLSLDISIMDSTELSQSGIQFFLLCVGPGTHGFAFRLFGFVGSEMPPLVYTDLHDTWTRIKSVTENPATLGLWHNTATRPSFDSF